MFLLLSILTFISSACLFAILMAAAIPVIINQGFRHAKCHSKRTLHGKTTLVTGASAGIGIETARDFATRGARVIIACRNIDKARIVADDIIRTSGNKNVVVYELDTSSLKSVRRCAAEVLKKENRLDILVSNAGILGKDKRILTEDGLELTMATNHYGHFLLTNLLLGLLKKCSPARIVTVTSSRHVKCQSLDLQDLKFDNIENYGTSASYNQSKLCNILFTYELARKLYGTGVTANCVIPGMTGTDIFGRTNSPVWKIFGYLIQLTSKTSTEGAQTTIYAAVSEKAANLTGKYFGSCRVKESSKLSKDLGLAKKLWDVSLRDVNLQPHEMHY